MFLNCHSYYSLRYGTITPEQLAEIASSMGIGSLALTDINNSTGMIDFVKACRQRGIKPIGGMEIRDDNKLLYTLIALNNSGFRETNEFLTWHNLNEAILPPCPPVFSNVLVIYPFEVKPPRKLKENEFIGIRPAEVRRLISYPSKQLRNKLVAFHPVSFQNQNDYMLHLYLRAIDKNTLLSKLTTADLASPDEVFLPPDLFKIAYEDYPDILDRTNRILHACEIDFDFTKVKNKKNFSGNRYVRFTRRERPRPKSRLVIGFNPLGYFSSQYFRFCCHATRCGPSLPRVGGNLFFRHREHVFARPMPPVPFNRFRHRRPDIPARPPPQQRPGLGAVQP